MYIYRLKFDNFFVDMSSYSYIGKREFRAMVEDFSEAWTHGNKPEEFAILFKQRFAFETVNIIEVVNVEFAE